MPTGDSSIEFRAACLNADYSEALFTVNQPEDVVPIHIQVLGTANCAFKIVADPAESWTLKLDSIVLVKYEGSDRLGVS